MDRLLLRVSRFCPVLLRERAFGHRWCLILWEVFPVSSMLSLSLVGASCAWTSAEYTEQSWVQAVVWHNVACTPHRMGTAVYVLLAEVQRGGVCGGPGRWLIQGPADFDVQNICSAAGAPTPLGDKLWWLLAPPFPHGLRWMATPPWASLTWAFMPFRRLADIQALWLRTVEEDRWPLARSQVSHGSLLVLLLLKPRYVPDLGLGVDLSPFST